MTTVFNYKFFAVNETPPSWLTDKVNIKHDVLDAMTQASPSFPAQIDSAMKFSVPNTAAIVSAMNIWSNYLDITFSDSLGTKNIVYGGWNPKGAKGSATTFTENGATGNYAILYNKEIISGVDLSQAAIGNWGGWVHMHELGHVLGLSHPNPLNNLSNDLRYTFMWDPLSTADGGTKIPLTPGMKDIKGLQAIYGESKAQDGNTTYKFTPTTIQLGQKNQEITIDPSKAVMTLWDRAGTEGGIDTIDASGFDNTQNLYIDLRAGHFSAIGTDINIAPTENDINGDGDPDGDTTYNVGIAVGAQIENAKGGSGADYLKGNDLANTLEGNGGADTLEGGKGSDTLKGGDGNDTYIYNTRDGLDTIDDTDGLGKLLLAGLEIKGKAGVTDTSQWLQLTPDTWIDRQNGILYLRSIVDGKPQLMVHKGGASVLLNDWAPSELGITIGAGTNAPAPAPATFTKVGDFKPVDFDATTAGIQTQLDVDGNVIVTNVAEPNRADELYGRGSNDLIQGLGGNDYLDGQAGDDRVEGGAGQDIMYGSGGNDTLLGGTENDIAHGNAGDDKLYVGAEIALDAAYTLGLSQQGTGLRGGLLSGGADNDTLVGAAGNDVLMGGMGKDIIMGLGGDDTIEGDANADTGNLNWTVTRTVTTEADVTIYYRQYNFSTSFPNPEGDDDIIFAGEGNDWVFAQGGDDFVDGGTGADVVFGEAGNDTIFGQDGNDVLIGDSLHPTLDASLHGDDYLNGGAGDDQLWGAAGSDYLDGGTGNDLLQGDGEKVPEAYEMADVLIGGAGNDSLFGGGANDVLYGGADNDYLEGGTGNDSQFGEAANDNHWRLIA